MSSEAPEALGRREERLLLALISVVAAVVLGLRAVPGSSLVALDHPFVDRVFAAGAEVPVDTSDVALVLVDDDSLKRLGERWPLRRRTWADFITVMNGYSPSVVALDAWFESAEPTLEADLARDVADKLRLTGLSADPTGSLLADQLDGLSLELDGDHRLAVALGGGPVILGTACVPTPTATVPVGLFTVDAPAPRMVCPGLSGNLAPLAVSARGQAGLDVMRDPDGLVRRYPYALRAGEARQASLALAAVTVGRPDAPRDRVLTLDGAAPFLRTIDPRQYTTVSFADVLFAGTGNEALAEAFRDRIVFVGVSAQGTEDLAFTALGMAVPGVTLHANAAIDLLQDRHVHSDGAPGIVGLLLGLGVLAGVGAAGSRASTLQAIAGVAFAGAALWAVTGAAAVAAGWLLPQVPVHVAVASWATVRLGFTWRRTDRALELTRTAKERMEAELRVGRDLQLAMVPTAMPPFARRDRVSVSAVLEPAREVGGDFYDYFVLPDGRLCFAVGDVSGKGVPAALFMARVQTLLRARASFDARPSAIVTQTNDEVARDNDAAMFVTLVIAILDLERGVVVYTNAGHNPPYVLRPDGSRLRLAARHGPVIGAVEALEYGEDTVTLAPGDQVLLFTDGVTEAMDPSAKLYGEDRLVQSLAAARDHGRTVAATLAGVRAFQSTADQADDITILALQYHGGPP